MVAHSLRAVNIDTLKALHQEAAARKMVFHTHLEEQPKEVRCCVPTAIAACCVLCAAVETVYQSSVHSMWCAVCVVLVAFLKTQSSVKCVLTIFSVTMLPSLAVETLHMCTPCWLLLYTLCCGLSRTFAAGHFAPGCQSQLVTLHEAS